jgi:hypothetical protein
LLILASNETVDGRSQNRRVEFAITANDKMRAEAKVEVGTKTVYFQNIKVVSLLQRNGFLYKFRFHLILSVKEIYLCSLKNSTIKCYKFKTHSVIPKNSATKHKLHYRKGHCYNRRERW